MGESAAKTATSERTAMLARGLKIWRIDLRGIGRSEFDCSDCDCSDFRVMGMSACIPVGTSTAWWCR
jgi:hypothetical protein